MEAITPESKEHWLKLRTQDVTSTEVSALFGLNPWITEFELWHRKKNKEIVLLEENERMKWGSRLESAIGNGIAEDEGWHIIPHKDYVRDPELRAGSSFDFKIGIPEYANAKEVLTIEGLLEIKNVDPLQIKDKWVIEDGKVIEAPPHIELQVQHQLMIEGLQFAYIGTLVGGNSVTLLKRTPQDHIINSIKNKIKKFWDSIDANTPPSPNFIQDAEFIASLYNSAEPGKIMNADEREDIQGLVLKYKEAADKEKQAVKEKKAFKAELLTLIGDSEKVTGDDFTISAGVVGPTQVSYEREGYRNLRVHFKKGKAKND